MNRLYFVMWTIDAIRNTLKPILQAKPVRLALLFGSYGRGTQDRRSDIDLILVVDTDKRFFERYDDYMEIPAGLRGAGVDLLIYTNEEWESMRERPFIKKAVGEGVILYER